MTTNQESRHASYRAISGTTDTYNGDALAAMAVDGFSSGTFNGRQIAWLQEKTGSDATNINDLRALYAQQSGVDRWDAVTSFGATQSLYDQVVDAAGGGSTTSISTGISNAGANSMVLVKSGSYTETVTAANNNVKVVIEPGTTITGGINITGSGVVFVIGAGGTVTGEIDVTTGTGNSIICKNGVTLSTVDINSADNYFTGGGWGTLVTIAASSLNAIDIAGADCITENIKASTTGSGNRPFQVNGLRGVWSNCFGSASINDTFGADSGLGSLIIGCISSGSTSDGIIANTPTLRIIGNKFDTATTIGINLFGAADNSVIVANVVDDTVTIAAANEDCVVVSNRVDTTITDNSGTSTVGSNNTNAF